MWKTNMAKWGEKRFHDSDIHKLVSVFGLGNTKCCSW